MFISTVIHVLADFGTGQLKLSGSKKCDCTISPVSEDELHEGGNTTQFLLSFSVRLPVFIMNIYKSVITITGLPECSFYKHQKKYSKVVVDLFIDDLEPKLNLKLNDVSTRKHPLRFLFYSERLKIMRARLPVAEVREISGPYVSNP